MSLCDDGQEAKMTSTERLERNKAAHWTLMAPVLCPSTEPGHFHRKRVLLGPSPKGPFVRLVSRSLDKGQRSHSVSLMNHTGFFLVWSRQRGQRDRGARTHKTWGGRVSEAATDKTPRQPDSLASRRRHSVHVRVRLWITTWPGKGERSTPAKTHTRSYTTCTHNTRTWTQHEQQTKVQHVSLPLTANNTKNIVPDP